MLFCSSSSTADSPPIGGGREERNNFKKKRRVNCGQLVWDLGAGMEPGSAGDPGAARCRAGGPDQHQCHHNMCPRDLPRKPRGGAVLRSVARYQETSKFDQETPNFCFFVLPFFFRLSLSDGVSPRPSSSNSTPITRREPLLSQESIAQVLQQASDEVFRGAETHMESSNDQSRGRAGAPGEHSRPQPKPCLLYTSPSPRD